MSQAAKLILVTGGGGYIGLNIIKLLANEPDVKIRATVRSLNDQKKLGSIKNAANAAKYPIEFVEANLLKSDSWSDAMRDVNIVLHVASPFPNGIPKDPENELIKPAVEGTLNVLNAAFIANVSRVVVTSSTAAINTFTVTNTTFTEDDWSDPEKALPYPKSKILAEKAAWNFVEEKKRNNEKCFELAVVNPCMVHGPTLGSGDVLGTSEIRVVQLFEGKQEKIPQMFFGHCDVRDVALAHLRCAFLPEAAGHRHIISSERKWFSIKRASDILAAEFTPKGYTVATELEPKDDPNNCLDNTRMIKVLGIQPTDYKKTIIDMVNSMIDAGIVKKLN